MSTLRRFAFCCVALISAGSVQAGQISINFDPPTFPLGMGNAPGTAVPAADQLTTVSTADPDVGTSIATFSTVGGSAFAAIVALSPPIPHAPSPPNGIGAADSTGALTYSLPIRVDFSTPGGVSPTNFVSITGDLMPVPPGATITLEGFNSSNVMIAITTQADTGSGVPLTISSPTASIAYAEFFSTYPGGALPNTVAFDNLVYNAVPEPTSVVTGFTSIMAFGLFRLRRRFTRKAQAA